jgi:hypothetical protein
MFPDSFYILLFACNGFDESGVMKWRIEGQADRSRNDQSQK